MSAASHERAVKELGKVRFCSILGHAEYYSDLLILF